ncbi:cyclase family protein [Nocardia sp. NPDC003345]
MCAPEIIGTVRDTVARAPRPGRRAFFGLSAAAVVAVSAAPAAAREPRGAVVDLTHPLSTRTPVWPGNPPFAMVPVAWDRMGGFNQNMLTLWEHTGTHLDAPVHRRSGAATTDALAAEDLVAPLAVVDISARAARDPEAVVTRADIADWEARYGRLPERAFVAMYSGWERRLARPEEFVGLDGDGVPHAPGFAGDTADFLVSERGIVGAGVDTLSLDRSADRDFPAHTAILGSGRYGVEMLANLAAVPPAGATIVVGAPKHTGGTGGPCRVLALT